VVWAFLARATSTALAPEHTPVDVSLPEGKGSAKQTLSVEVEETAGSYEIQLLLEVT